MLYLGRPTTEVRFWCHLVPHLFETRGSRERANTLNTIQPLPNTAQSRTTAVEWFGCNCTPVLCPVARCWLLEKGLRRRGRTLCCAPRDPMHYAGAGENHKLTVMTPTTTMGDGIQWVSMPGWLVCSSGFKGKSYDLSHPQSQHTHRAHVIGCCFDGTPRRGRRKI